MNHTGKHKSIAAALIIGAAACSLLIFLSVRGRMLNAPEKAVRDSLSEIQHLDVSAAAGLFRASSSSGAQGASLHDVSQDEAEALRLFFRGFSFRILDSHTEENRASVEVEARGTDAAELASLIRRQQLEDAYDASSRSSDEEDDEKDADDTGSIFPIMKNILSSSSLKTARSRETLTVTYGREGWSVVSDSSLKNLLTGGLLEDLRDPYLLSPEDVLSVYLDRYRSMPPSEWAQELKSEDLFQTSSTSYDDLDRAYFQKISETYAYHIDDVRTEGAVADVTASITSIDMTKVLSSYRQKLIAYARTTDSITADSVTLSDKSAALLTESIRQDAVPETVSLTVRLENDGENWQIRDASGLTNALLGDIQSAVAAFNENS